MGQDRTELSVGQPAEQISGQESQHRHHHGRQVFSKKLLSILMLCLVPIALLAGSGDVNGDDKIDVADIVEIRNFLLGTPSASFNATEADVSRDGKIDETDIRIIDDAIMSGETDIAAAIEYYALQEQIRRAQEEIEQLNDKINNPDPELLHMEFLASENPMQMVEDAECEIIGDNAVECRVLNIMTSKTLVPRFTFTGDRVTISGKDAESSKTAIDFGPTQTLVVYSGEKTKEYTVTVSAYTGLPTVWAETENRKLKEANTYYNSTIKITDNVGYGGNGSLAKTSGKMMALGSLRYYSKMSDWSGETEWGKNDYKVYFSSAKALLDMPAHKYWQLMSNFNDITMLHNKTAFYMSEISKLGYTPRFRYVDLMFNGRYMGTCMLGESLDIGSSGVNVGSDGYILSAGTTATGSSFTPSNLGKPISILYPASPSSSAVSYIQNFVTQAESALFGSNFTNETSGWQKYMDADSFVDWYLINEIAKNTKGAFGTKYGENCIMSLKRGGKLKMGPVWDFETAFGEAGKTSATGFAIKSTPWYFRLFQDPAFVAKVKERFNYFYTHQADIIRDIDSNAQYLKYAIQEDDSKWEKLITGGNSKTDRWALYQGHVSGLKGWIADRMEWLKGQFNAMSASRSAERAQWNAEQILRNAEQGLLDDSMSDVVDSLLRERNMMRDQTFSLTEEADDPAEDDTSLAGRNGQLRLMWEDLQQRIEELESILEGRDEPKLLSMEFLKSDNKSLKQDATCKIVGDSIIECWLSGIVTDKSLKPRFTFNGTMVVIDGFEAKSGSTKIDFKKPRTVVVATSDKNKYYTIYVHSYTGLPMMHINTDGGQEVTSKDQYIGAKILLREDVRKRAPGDVTETRVNIKGRGNSSWKFPKKPFTLKFDEKKSLLDMTKDKSWVLIPNYNDKSMLRNSLAFYMSSISNMDYTPESHFVELVFNDKHWGTYLLCEKLKIAKHRVNVGDNGFLFEIDSRAKNESDSRYFEVSHLENVVNIKDPDVQYNDANFNYAKDFVTKADKALFSSSFKNPSTGWQAYLDMDSFVDWYLIQEIGKNLDGNYDTSCYMHLARGGKLKMGPMWDMDVAFGNIDQANQTCYDPEGFYIKDVQWYTRLFQDPVFVNRVKERFNYFYNHQDDILANVNADAQYLKYSAQENDDVWHLLNVKTWPNYNIWGSYQNEVQGLKEWFVQRMNWLKTQFDKM